MPKPECLCIWKVPGSNIDGNTTSPVLSIHIHFCHFQVKRICRQDLTPPFLKQNAACFLIIGHEFSPHLQM